MRFYAPIDKVDAEQRMVWGYASTEALDEQGEIIRREAIDAALADYMKFANIREMHQPSAVGVAKEAAVDGKGLYLGAKVVDGRAWEKVVEGVYKGFSVGGRVKARDPGDRKIITALTLTEISLVDRPANPEAIFDCFKRSEPSDDEPVLKTVELWSCGDAEHLHPTQQEATACIAKRAPAVRDAGAGDDAAALAAKATAAADRLEGALSKAEDIEYADPGYQADGKKRYPVDTQEHIRAAWSYIHQKKNAAKYTAEQLAHIERKITAAWKDKIDPAGPPEAKEKASGPDLRKHLYDVGHVAQVIIELNWLKDALAMEAIMEGDDSAASQELQAIVDRLCEFLVALVAEETAEIMSDSEDPGSAPIVIVELASTLAGHIDEAKFTAWCDKVRAAAAEREAEAETARKAAESEDLAKRAAAESELEELAKRLDAALADKGVLEKALGELTPRLDALAARVEQIALTPLPPATAGVVTRVAKGGAGEPTPADGDILAQLAAMSPEQRTLTLIKAAHAKPIPVAAG